MNTEAIQQNEKLPVQSVAYLELPRIDAEELREELSIGEVSISPYKGLSSVAHDMLTVMVAVLLSREAIRVLALYITRESKRSDKTFSFEVTKPDGTKQSVTFKSSDESSSSQDKVIEAIEKILGKPSDTALDSFSK